MLLQGSGLKMAVKGTESFLSVFEMQDRNEIPEGGKGSVGHILLYFKTVGKVKEGKDGADVEMRERSHFIFMMKRCLLFYI